MKILQEQLKGAGFDVIIENIRSQWNPEEEDFAGIQTLVTSLIGKPELISEQEYEQMGLF